MEDTAGKKRVSVNSYAKHYGFPQEDLVLRSVLIVRPSTEIDYHEPRDLPNLRLLPGPTWNHPGSRRSLFGIGTSSISSAVPVAATSSLRTQSFTLERLNP